MSRIFIHRFPAEVRDHPAYPHVPSSGMALLVLDEGRAWVQPAVCHAEESLRERAFPWCITAWPYAIAFCYLRYLPAYQATSLQGMLGVVSYCIGYLQYFF